MNVAFHLRNFGLSPKLVSRVGADALGQELQAFLTEKGLTTALLQTGQEAPTSTVQVTLDEAGHASYEIVAPVAWDYIALRTDNRSAVREADAIVFGSLASRSAATRATLLELLEEERPLKVFDVNLRPPHYSKALLETLLAKADIVKMNEEELDIISSWYGLYAGEPAKMEELRQRFGLQGLLLTKGGDGAAWMGKDSSYIEQPAFDIKVADTVGSGDSFLAAFLSQYLAGFPLPQALEFAAATGALVATFQGGTPSVFAADVNRFRKTH